MRDEAQPLQGGTTLLADLERYWRDLAGPSALPARAAVDPVRIDAALSHSFILERIAPGLGRFRVAGRRIVECLGAEARGLPFSAIFNAVSRPPLAEWLERVWAAPALVDLPVASARAPGQPRLTGRLLLLPLLDQEGRATRALGALFADGQPGRTPRSFDIDGGGMIRFETMSGDRPERRAPSRPKAVRAGLRLVVSNT